MEALYPRKVVLSGTSLMMAIPKVIRVALKIERGDLLMFGVYDDTTFYCRKITPEEVKRLKPRVIEF